MKTLSEVNNINVRKIKENQKTNSNIIQHNNKQTNNENLREPFIIQNLEDKEEWLQSAEDEFSNMEDLNVYERVENHEVPNNTNIIKSRLIFKYKRNAVGKITQRKTRLVAKGFTQQYGIDYKDTFAPTLKLDSIRIFTYIVVRYNFQIEQIDVNTAYLNANLRNEL